MATLHIFDASGRASVVEAGQGQTVMQIVRESGAAGMEALCGGCCSCATCHVYVAPAFADLLPAIGEDEDALLDCSDHRATTSRLACQIVFDACMDGMSVTVAPVD